MKILITGANSFIGKYFSANCNFADVSEVCLIKNKVKDIDFAKYDVVFHVAAIVHQDKEISDETYFKVNSDLAIQVATKAKLDGVKQFVFMSTVKVYGENSTSDNPWTEDSECNPVDAYGRSKLDAEVRLLDMNSKDFTVSVIRTPVVYGANVKGNILKITKFVLSNRVIPFNGIDNIRAMVFIGNLVYIIKEVIKQNKSGVFLANDVINFSTSDFVRNIIKEAEGKKIFIPIPKIVQNTIALLKPSFYNRLFGSMVIDNSNTIKKLKIKLPYSNKYGIKEIINGIK